MLPEELSALAAATATGIVQAAGTDLWSAVRERVARLWRRGRSGAEQEDRAERATRERLEETGRELAAAEDRAAADGHWQDRWRTRLQDFLEDLPVEEQEAAVRELQAMLAETGAQPSPGVRADHGGVAAGGNIHNERGVIAGSIEGDVTIGGNEHAGTDRPTPPGPAPR
ncbi:hypothetical protein [Streptomyces sp. NRRL WC-3742]|uniref:hypothetical protein n=1 Tax=Streptomyces sp. NRRL WC-3742 TaxID=1463934 RepID=UPI000689C594|nr:hypothetical protein [Streptomyces sp. NRRL WC-3742]